MNAGVQTPEGQNVIDIKLRRHQDGVRVRVWTDPSIEAFFERWGGGNQEDVRASGRLWYPFRPTMMEYNLTYGPPRGLQLWSIPPDQALRDAGDTYTLMAPGHHLTTDGGMANLTMIRLVGTSNPSGLEFLCDAVVSRSELERIATKLRRASEAFYAEYIQPVGMHIYVGTKQIQA